MSNNSRIRMCLVVLALVALFCLAVATVWAETYIDRTQVVISSPVSLETSRGDVPNALVRHVRGYNGDVDTGAEDLWDYGGTKTFPASAFTAYISSSSAADLDTTAYIYVEGLDVNWDYQTGSAILNGQTFTTVTATLTWRRCWLAMNRSSANAQGTIYVSSTSTGSGGVPTNTALIQLTIPAASQRSRSAIFTVPADYTGYVKSFMVSATDQAKWMLRSCEPDQGWQIHDEWLAGTLDPYPVRIEYDGYLKFPEKTDIVLRATATNDNTLAAGGFDILCLKE